MQYLLRLAGALSAIFFLSPSHLRAAVYCDPAGEVCLDAITHEDRGGVDLWAISRRPCSLTIQVDARPENLSPATKTLTLQARQSGRQKIASLRVADKSRPWNLAFDFYSLCGLTDAPPADFSYWLPVEPGRAVKVSQGFHGRASHHDPANAFATDFDLPVGTPVHSARDGLVVEVVQKFGAGGPLASVDEVNLVRVQHDDHSVAEYAHLLAGSAVVKVGDKVSAGTRLALSGNSGRSTGPHLHFAVHVPRSGRERISVPIHFAGEGLEGLQSGKIYVRPLLAAPPVGLVVGSGATSGFAAPGTTLSLAPTSTTGP